MATFSKTEYYDAMSKIVAALITTGQFTNDGEITTADDTALMVLADRICDAIQAKL